MRLNHGFAANHLSRISIIVIKIAGLVVLSGVGIAMAKSAPEGPGKIELLGLLAGGSSNGYIEL
jgi:hypothetical protein